MKKEKGEIKLVILIAIVIVVIMIIALLLVMMIVNNKKDKNENNNIVSNTISNTIYNTESANIINNTISNNSNIVDNNNTVNNNIVSNETTNGISGREVYDAARNTTEQAQGGISDQAKEAFNAMFKAFEGTGISGTQVKQLERSVQSSNYSQPEHQISFVSTSGEIDSTKQYTITLSYDNNGYVNKIEVS